MKTLIFNGSARKNGETQSMIDALTAQLEGEYKIVNAHSCNVRACIDCRYCWEHPECSIQDGWQEIDSYLRECDNVVIASPVYFCEITGPVLSVLSRIQVYWAAKTFRHEKLLESCQEYAKLWQAAQGSASWSVTADGGLKGGSKNA